MIKTQLLKYIKASIEDEYTMEVLYYCIKNAALSNGLAFENATSIVIDGKFHGEPIQIGINNRFQTQIKTVSLLLSVRALMQDKNYLKCCADDNLIFTSSVFGKFQWIELTTIIRECMDDDEFYRLYEMLEDLYFNEEVSDETIQELKDNLIIPEYRHLDKYYKEIASNCTGIIDEVICDNAFVNEDIEEFTVPNNIAYIGNTSFSYCSNLTKIEFNNKVAFGIFPIIECVNLKKIVVPSEYIEYYREKLPYYKSIITDNGNEVSAETIIIEDDVDSNKGKRWTTDEEEKVRHFFGLGHSFKAIAKAMGRTEIAIKARLGKLGLINYTYTKDEIDSVSEDGNRNKDLVQSISDAIEKSRSFTMPQQYYDFFKSYSIDLPEALEILFTANTFCATYVLVKIAGDPNVCTQLGWKQLEESDIKHNKKIALKNNISEEVYSLLYVVLRGRKCPIKNIGSIPVDCLDYPTFKIAFTDHLTRKVEKEGSNIENNSKNDFYEWFNSSKGWSISYKESSSKKKDVLKTPQPQEQPKKEEESMYDKYEYGLSDW